MTVRKKNYDRHSSKSSHFSKAWERMTLRRKGRCCDATEFNILTNGRVAKIEQL